MATLFIGQNKVFLPVTESTNSYAISLLKNVNLPEGSVIYTDLQTAGKGQRGNSWESDLAMNMTLSLVLKPTFLGADNIFFISKLCALAVHDVLTEILNESQNDIKIKWPNDLLVNQKKIAGILIENSFSDRKINWSVAGIGININQVNFNSTSKATSIKSITHKEQRREEISETLFEKIEKWYLKLKQNKFDEIDLAYHNQLFGLNHKCSFEMNQNILQGTILGVNHSGRLKVEMNNGIIQEFEMKEIKLLF